MARGRNMGRSEHAPRLRAARASHAEIQSSASGGGEGVRDVDVDGVVFTSVEPTIEPSLRVDVRHDLRHAAATILLLLATIRDDSDDERLSAAH